ncbi:MAG: hypothetical protein DMF79_11765 [Acidobacteria bacterium]|nr:MAG: hypothetical protein DMF79_11765 [Acidobacteriota bacterium]
MNRRLATAALLCLAGAAADPLRAQESPEPSAVVERVEILNNQYIQKETLLFYVSTKPGDRYDERRLKEDFRRLWDTGFLNDLTLEVLDSPQGKVVRFRVDERARIQIVDYRGSKELTTTNIEDEIKKRDAQLRIDTFYDPAKARHVEGIIREMLAQKGRPFPTVKHDSKRIGGAGTQVSFTIDDGPKARVKEVVFDGNKVFSERRSSRRASGTSPGWAARPPTPRTSGWAGERTREGTRAASRTST